MKRKTLRSLSWDTTILEGVNDMLKDRVAMSRNLSRLRNKPRGMSLKSEKSCSWDGKKKKKNRNQYRLQADCLEIRLAKRDVGDFIGTSWIWFSSLAFREKKKSSALAQAMPGDWGKWACFFHMAASGLVMGFVLPRTKKKTKTKTVTLERVQQKATNTTRDWAIWYMKKGWESFRI